MKTYQERLELVDQSRYESKQFLMVHKLIIEELLKRYSYIQLPDRILKNIQKRLNTDLLSYDADSVRKLIVQVEALFVFAVFKSVLAS